MDTNTMRPPSDTPTLKRLLTVDELAEYLGIPIATIYDWRVDGKGPRGLRIGRHVRFAVGDVEAWLDELREPRRMANTSGRVSFDG